MEPAIIVALIALCGTIAVPVVNGIIERRKEARRARAAKKERERENKEKEAERTAKKKAEEQARLLEAEREQSEALWRAEVKEIIRPISEDIGAVKVDVKDVKMDVEKLTSAAVLGFRVDLKIMRDRVVDSGVPADIGEKSTWKEIYKKYYKFGGNNFHDYVDGWGIEMGFTEDQLALFREEVNNGN